MNVFNVPTSSAHNVDSSELSLTVTSGHPSGTVGFRTLNVPPRVRCQIFMNSRKPSVRPFLLSLQRFVTMFSMRPSPIFLLVLQRIDQICAQALRYCMCFEDLGLIDTLTYLYDQKAVWLLPIVFLSTNRAPPIVAPFSPRYPPDLVFQRETVAMRAQV